MTIYTMFGTYTVTITATSADGKTGSSVYIRTVNRLGIQKACGRSIIII
ncbi:hypothetical protein ACIQUM_37535 [Amycolatopsis azurea]